MKRLIGALSLSGLLLLLADCGVEIDSTFSCDQRSTSEQSCTDYENYAGDAAAGKKSCTQEGGTVRETLCSRTGVIGGCRLVPAGAEGSVLTVWYYSGMVSAIMQACNVAGGTFMR